MRSPDFPVHWPVATAKLLTVLRSWGTPGHWQEGAGQLTVLSSLQRAINCMRMLGTGR